MKKVVSIVFLSFFIAIKSYSIEVLDMKCAESIEDKEPVNVSDVFDNYIGKVYCWTRVLSKAKELPTYIYHVWYYKDKEMARVKLYVWSPNFRTWSSKIILPSWIGEWKIVVKDKDGNLLAEKIIEIVPKDEFNQ